MVQLRPSCGITRAAVSPPLPSVQRGVPASISASHDDLFLAYCSAKNVSLLRSSDSSFVHSFIGHAFPTSAVSFSPNSQLLATGDERGSVRIWSTATPYNLRKTFEVLGGKVCSIAWSGDGKALAVVGEGRAAAYINAETGYSMFELTCHQRVQCVAIRPVNAELPKESQLVMGSNDTRVSVFEGIPKMRYRTLLRDHIKTVNAVAYSPCGSLIASASSDGTVNVYDSITLLKVACIDAAHSGAVYGVCIVADEEDAVPRASEAAEGDAHMNYSILTTGTDGAVVCRRLRKNNEKCEEVWRQKQGASRVALAVAGRSVVAVDVASRIDRLSIEDGEVEWSLRGHSQPIIHSAYSDRTKTLVTVDVLNTVCVWDVSDGTGGSEQDQAKFRSTFQLDTLPSHVFFSEDDYFISFVCASTVVKKSLKEGTGAEENKLCTSPLDAVATSECGTCIAWVEKATNVVNLQCGDERLNFPLEETKNTPPAVLAISRSHLAVAILDTVYIPAIESSRTTLIATLKAKGPVSLLRFSSDCKLAVADANRYVTVAAGEAFADVRVVQARAHNASIRALAWNEHGTRIATGSSDLSLVVCDVEEAGKEPLVHTHAQSIRGVHWTSDSSSVLTVGDDGAVVRWKVDGMA